MERAIGMLTAGTSTRDLNAHFSTRGEHFLTEVGYNAELQSGQDPGEDEEHTDELP